MSGGILRHLIYTTFIPGLIFLAILFISYFVARKKQNQLSSKTVIFWWLSMALIIGFMAYQSITITNKYKHDKAIAAVMKKYESELCLLKYESGISHLYELFDIAKSPDDYRNAYQTLAWAYYVCGDHLLDEGSTARGTAYFDSALLYYDKEITASLADNENDYREAGSDYYFEGNICANLKQLDRAKIAFDSSVVCYTRALEDDSKSRGYILGRIGSAYWGWGNELLKQGDFINAGHYKDSAFASYDKIIADNPKADYDPYYSKGEIYWDWGKELFKRGQIPAAKIAYDSALIFIDKQIAIGSSSKMAEYYRPAILGAMAIADSSKAVYDSSAAANKPAPPDPTGDSIAAILRR
jgi:tetratricopeptide (TPR) repeat protein